MPQRLNLNRVETPKVQGDDSYVVVRKISGKMGFRLMAMSAKVREGEADVELTREIADTALGQVREWNWVDDDGEPLPVPSKIEEPLETLTLEEIMEIVNALTGGGDQGNSESGLPDTSD